MVFSSLEFLIWFFPIVLVGYFFLPPKMKNFWLFAVSIFFYYLGSKDYLWLFLSVIGIAYVGGIVETKLHGEKQKKIALVLSVATMLSFLAYFKYFNFVVFNINVFFDQTIEFKEKILPIGISFFTFQAISYVVDVYRGEEVIYNPIDMGLYIAFFPQLIAGPIVRFHDVRKYFDSNYRKNDFEKFSAGIWRFSVGFCKKVLIANNIGGLANLVYSVRDISEFSVLYTWLGAIAYSLQIYYDFSGYSDMAIGLGKIFGFEFQENFNYPYFAGTIKDFWRRWHISLSQFFRDYVYIPLGGNRCSKIRWMINIAVVWFLTGIWHGASWNYIIWGCSYGVLLLIERFVVDKIPQTKIVIFTRRLLTIFIVIMLFVVFKCEHISIVIKYFKNMFGIGAASFIDSAFIFQFKNFAGLIFVSILLALPVKELIEQKIGNSIIYKFIKAAVLLIGIIASVSYIYMGNYNPFLYFMF